jgi:hypothetical protein
MAILARCCAGTLKRTITDRSDAYGNLLKHLEFKTWLDSAGVERQQAKDTQTRQGFVSSSQWCHP